MAPSAIRVADVSITTYQQLKLGKKLKYILFAIDDLNEIVVAKASDATNFETFIEDLPKDQCRWAVYDFEFTKEDGRRNKLCFISWSPDAADIKDKMRFAFSHEAFRQRLEGVAFEVQATDRSEISHATVLAKALTSTH